MLPQLCLLILAACAGNAQQHYEMLPAFTNNQMEHLVFASESRTLKANTCGLHNGDFDVIISVFLPKNPSAIEALGLVSFKATSTRPSAGQVVAPEDQICETSFDHFTTECQTRMNSNWTEIYVTVTGNLVPDINFDVTVSFQYNASRNVNRKVEMYQPKKSYVWGPEAISADSTIDDLEPFYEIRANVQSSYLEGMLFEVKLCPADSSGSKLKVTSIFQANDKDGLSTVAQWMCNKEPCDLSPEGMKNVIGMNAQALPFNYYESAAGNYKNIYVYAQCYNGVLAPSAQEPVGDFIFGVTTKSST